MSNKPERQPSSAKTPWESTHPSLPRIIDLPPSGQEYVIGGCSPPAQKPDEKPELVLGDGADLTFEDAMGRFESLTG